MMSKNCLHGIKLLNLHGEDVITHQVLLVKGLVESPKCYKEQDIELSVQNSEILATGVLKDTGRFKFLLNLGTENRNYELNFTYCTAKLTINISYVRKDSIYKVQPLLVLTKDEQEQCEEVCLNLQIIDLNLLLIQTVYSEKLKEAVSKRLHFVFNDKCRVFSTNLRREEVYCLNEQELWLEIAKELLETDWGKKEELKFVAFINCSKYLGEEVLKSKDFSYQNIRKHIKGHAALGAGGLALFSTTYFYSWPSEFKNIFGNFLNKQNLNLAFEPDDSNYRKTRGGVYASSLGAVCHEIGHIFDLGHDLQGVMGSNFDYINTVFTLTTKTEHLPERIVEQKHQCQPKNQTKTCFTRIKDPTRGFLQCYREQLENDSFYFSANSAAILSHHAWLRNDIEEYQNKIFDVELDKSLGIVKSVNVPLKIIEIRECGNSLVKEWFDLEKSLHRPAVFEFSLENIKVSLSNDYYLFIMSHFGHTKKIYIS